VSIIVILLCCRLFILFTNHNHFRNKPVCHPLEFPSLERRPNPVWGEIYEYRTDQSVKEVIQLLDNKLGTIVLSDEEPFYSKPDSWIRKEITDGTQVYQCFSSADIAISASEQGCMYVKETSEGTLIQTRLNIYETSTWLCDDPSIMP